MAGQRCGSPWRQTEAGGTPASMCKHATQANHRCAGQAAQHNTKRWTAKGAAQYNAMRYSAVQCGSGTARGAPCGSEALHLVDEHKHECVRFVHNLLLAGQAHRQAHNDICERRQQQQRRHEGQMPMQAHAAKLRCLDASTACTCKGARTHHGCDGRTGTQRHTHPDTSSHTHASRARLHV